MTDISGTIIATSDQLNAGDFIGEPTTITVDRTTVKQSQDRRLGLHTVDPLGLAYRPSKTIPSPGLLHEDGQCVGRNRSLLE